VPHCSDSARRSFARRFAALALWLALGWTLAAPDAAQAQANFDRPGADYSHRNVTSGDPADCAIVCERDRRCRAWTFAYPKSPDDHAQCWLKNAVPPRVENRCCVSGVRGAGVLEPRNSAFEAAIDRFGGDYRNFEMKAGEGDDVCKAACVDEHKCRAWTYARPGYVGRNARCFLKSQIKPPRRKAGFISGVVR
jgi:hypothetical protein